MKRCENCNIITTEEHSFCPKDGHILVDDEVATRLQAALGTKYTLTELIGKGAMGAVYRARHRDLDDVAIKVMLGPPNNQQLSERFIREARALRKLRHQHAVTIYDVDRSTPGLTYMVMEMIAGGNLREDLRERGRLTLDEVMEIATAVCGALQAAHERGIIHRDIKPDNILMAEETTITGKVLRTIKIADFGIVKLRGNQRGGEASIKLTQYGTPIGTPFYMSPEQWFGEGVDITALDGRTDIYALGCTLYELLSGRTPFTGNTTSELRRLHLEGEPVPLHELVKNVPEPVSRAIMKTLAKDRDERYSSAAEFLADLRSAYDQSYGKTVTTTRSQLFSKQLAQTIDPSKPPSLPLAVESAPVVDSRPSTLPKPHSSGQQALTEQDEDEQEPMPIRLAKAVEEARRRIEQEAQSRAEEERLRAEEEARRIAAEEERKKAEEETRRREEEEARLRAEAERLRAEEEAKQRAEEEAKRRALEEERLRAEQEARRKAEEEAQRRAEEERLRAEAEARQRAEQERLRAEEEARRKAEEEERLRAEQERRLAEEEAARKRHAEEEARRQAEEENARRRAEEEAAHRRAEEEEAARRAEEERQRLERERRESEERERALALERERIERERAEHERVERERAEHERAEHERLERERVERERLEEEERARAKAAVEQSTGVEQPPDTTTMVDKAFKEFVAEAAPSMTAIQTGPEEHAPVSSLAEVAPVKVETQDESLAVEASAQVPATNDDAHQASIMGYTSGGPGLAVDAEAEEASFDPEVTLVPGTRLTPEQKAAMEIAAAQESQPPQKQPPASEHARPASISQPASGVDQPQAQAFKPAPEYTSWSGTESQTPVARKGSGRRKALVVATLLLLLLAVVGGGTFAVIYIYRLITSEGKPTVEQAVDEDASSVLATMPKGTITINAPQGSEVFIDDERVGATSGDNQLTTQTLSGVRNVRVMKSGSRPWSEDVKIGAGATAKRAARFQRDIKAVDADHDRGNQIATYLRSENYYGAEVEYRAMSAENPSDPAAHIGLADALYKQERYAEALVEYEAALRLQPNNIKTLISLGKVYEIKRRDADAEGAFTRAVQLQPKNDVAQGLLAWVLLRRGKIDQAASAIEQALQIKNDPEYLDTKAYILLARGSFDEALKIAQGNVDKGQDPSFKAAQALTLYRMGRTDEAVNVYRQLRKSSRDDEWGDLKRLMMLRGYSKSMLETLAELIRKTN